MHRELAADLKVSRPNGPVQMPSRETDLHAFFDLSLDLLCVAGFDGYFKVLNPAWERQLGYSLDELCALPFLDFVHPDDRESTAEQAGRLATGEDVIRFVNRYRCADGGYRWLNWTASPHVGGELIYAVARDISDQRRKEQELKASEQRFRTLIHTAPSGILISDSSGNIVLANRLVEEMFGYPSETLTGQPVEMLVPEQFRTGHQQLRSGFDKDPKQRSMGVGRNLKGRRSDGSEFPVAVGLAPLPSDDGSLIAATITDMTEQRKAESELKHANDQLQARIADLQDMGRDADLIREMGEMLLASHGSAEAHQVIDLFAHRLFTRGAGSVGLMNESRDLVERVVSWGAVEEREQVFDPRDCWAMRRGKPHSAGEDSSRLECSHLQMGDARLSLCVPLLAQGEALGVLTISCAAEDLESAVAWPRIEHLSANFADHLALALANLKLRDSLQLQSIRDTVTGLFNRRYLEESLQREVARAMRCNTALGVIMLDLDYFKEFNDTHGHRAGDAALAALGGLLQTLVRGEDVPCRYGGEEFAVILPDANLRDVVHRAEEIREALANVQISHAGRDLGGITMSAGAAAFPEHGRTAEGLLLSADRALYRAKKQGRNRVVVAESS